MKQTPVHLSQVKKDYKLGTVHNPKEFFSNSFYTVKQNGRLVLKGRFRKTRRERIVAYLKKA